MHTDNIDTVEFIVTGKRLVLPAIFNLKTEITIRGKNVGTWGWSTVGDVAEFINDYYEFLGLPRVRTRLVYDYDFIFDRFGLLNAHDNSGKALITWINVIRIVENGDKPTNNIDYDMSIHLPSGWVVKIREALQKGIVRVYTERQKSLTGQDHFKIVGERVNGTHVDIIVTSTSIHILPSQE